MSSDYEAHGSISNSQLAPQRKPDDTYFGELVLKNMKTGDSVADNIRSEIFDGSTADLRMFNKKGEKYGFNTTVSFPVEYDTSGYPASIENITGVPVDSISYIKRTDIQERQYQFAQYSMDRSFHYDSSLASPAIGSIEVSGTVKEFKALEPDNDPYGTYETIVFVDDTKEVTSIPLAGVSDDGYSAFPTYIGFYAEYRSGTEEHYMYSTSSVFIIPEDVSHAVEFLPVVSFQDSFNYEHRNSQELPYEASVPPEKYQYIRRDKTIGALGVEFAEMSRQIFSYIPPLGSREWNETYGYQWSNSPKLQDKYDTQQDFFDDISSEVNIPPSMSDPEWSDYSKSWRSNIKNCCKTREDNGECSGSYDNNPLDSQREFCDDNPTEADYHANLIEDKEKAAENIKNITDVHFGMFATAKLLDQENCVALYYTLTPILKEMKKSSIDGINCRGLIPSFLLRISGAYKMNIKAGSFDAKYAFTDWSMCRRYGVADPILYPPGVKTAKFHHGDYTIDEGSSKDWNTGDTYHQRDSSFEDERPPDAFTDGPTSEEGCDQGVIANNMLELRVQDRPEPGTGRAMFLELRLYNPMAEHIVDVLRDGEHGKAQTTRIFGGLNGFYTADDEKPYSDVLIWPLTYKSCREVRIFRRERLIRECTIVNIGAIVVEEIKWYQQGWFKIVMVIVALVVSYFTGFAGYAGMQAVLASAAVMGVLYVISVVVTNPILKAIISIAMIYFTGYVDTNSLLQNAALLVEAAGVVVQTKIAMDMIKLEQEMKEFRKMVNEKEKEIEKMKLEVGMDDFNAEWMLYIASLAPTEYADDFFERTLKTDIDMPSVDGQVLVGTVLPTPQA